VGVLVYDLVWAFKRGSVRLQWASLRVVSLTWRAGNVGNSWQQRATGGNVPALGPLTNSASIILRVLPP
jgi:hypothetical protein